AVATLASPTPAQLRESPPFPGHGRLLIAAPSPVRPHALLRRLGRGSEKPAAAAQPAYLPLCSPRLKYAANSPHTLAQGLRPHRRTHAAQRRLPLVQGQRPPRILARRAPRSTTPASTPRLLHPQLHRRLRPP